mmetsp:Transcript_28287/g.39472  ORF Transcript_28287/g.39472 Transcript_28287/m.39472 type:complete len:110 (-) Transcript_28287:232-561(-)
MWASWIGGCNASLKSEKRLEDWKTDLGAAWSMSFVAFSLLAIASGLEIFLYSREKERRLLRLVRGPLHNDPSMIATTKMDPNPPAGLRTVSIKGHKNANMIETKSIVCV